MDKCNSDFNCIAIQIPGCQPNVSVNNFDLCMSNDDKVTPTNQNHCVYKKVKEGNFTHMFSIIIFYIFYTFPS